MTKNMDEMKGEQAVCKILSHSRFILNLTGFWPERSWQESTMYKVRSSSMLILYGTIMFFNVVMMCTYNNDETDLIPSSILESIKKSGRFLSIGRSLGASLIMENWHLRAARIVKWFTVVVIFFLISFCTFPIVLSDRELPTGIDLPTALHDTPWFYLIYCADILLCSVGVGAFLTEDVFLTFFVTNVCGELECIAVEMKKFGRDTSSSFIRNIIENHVIAIAHGNEICQLVSTVLYMEIITGVMIACTSGFTVLMCLNTAITGNALAILFICVIRVFMISFFGETLSQMSLKVHRAVINSDWYRCNKKDQNAIQLVLLQAQRPLQLRVGSSGVMNLRGFSVYIFHLYSSMTVLNKVIEH